MTFTTITFLVFYLVFFGLYWSIARRKKTLQNLLIIAGSYLFYGWWDWRFLLLLIFSSLVDFTNGWLIGRTERQGRRKLFLGISLVAQLGLLGFFKYYDFFAASFADVLQAMGIQASPRLLHIILPVGISFYTFQTLSYVIDVYQRKLSPTRNIIDFLAFVSFFPQLVAGPIERAANMIPQFAKARAFRYDEAVDGLRLMLWGFFKKLVIADTLAKLVDAYYKDPSAYSTGSAWVALFAFSFQIYCDFSGYSDIAIGCGKTLGVNLMTNFRTPYFSRSFTEFWQRWHISLSTWFRDYVFIPLGGNRAGLSRYAVNILITFLLSGFWHGANYTFILWGGIHALLLIAEKIIRIRTPRFRWPPLFVFLMVSFCWVPFRAENITVMADVFRHIGGAGSGARELLIWDRHTLLLFGAFLLFLATEAWLNKHTFAEKITSVSRPLRWAFYYLTIGIIFLLADFNNAPAFIYFQF